MFLCLKGMKTLQILFPDTEDACLKYVFEMEASLSNLNTLLLLKGTNDIKAVKSLNKSGKISKAGDTEEMIMSW